MNSAIANILKQRLETLPFADTVAGLVTTAERKIDKRTSLFPISRDVTHDDCINGRYTDLIPNDKKVSMLYFEDGGTTFVQLKGKNKEFISRLTLVGWLNLAKFGLTDIDITSSVVSAIMKELDIRNINDGLFQQLTVSVLAQLPKSKNIFGSYTFREEAQYLMFPFDYFALSVSVRFQINTSCIPDFVMGTEDDCLDC